MELQLEPIIPMTRVINGHNSFNKGYKHPIRGKTYEEYYGEEKAFKKRLKMSQSQKGHPGHGNKAASKPCVAIHDGRIMARFNSAVEASECLGLNTATIRRYLKNVIKPKNAWQWFYEKESYKWGKLLK